MKTSGGHAQNNSRYNLGSEDDKVVLLLHEIELLMSEKRTALSVMRTGIAILALPLSVLSVLIATSKFYEISKVIHFLIPLLLINLGLIILSCYLIVKSLIKFRRLDQLIGEMKRMSATIEHLVK